MVNIASILMAVRSWRCGLTLELACRPGMGGRQSSPQPQCLLQQALWGGGWDARCHKKPDFGTLSSPFPSQSTRELNGETAGTTEPTIICLSVSLSHTYTHTEICFTFSLRNWRQTGLMLRVQSLHWVSAVMEKRDCGQRDPQKQKPYGWDILDSVISCFGW